MNNRKLQEILQQIGNFLITILDWTIFFIPTIISKIIYYKRKKEIAKKRNELEEKKKVIEIELLEKEIKELKENKNDKENNTEDKTDNDRLI